VLHSSYVQLLLIKVFLVLTRKFYQKLNFQGWKDLNSWKMWF